MEFSFSSLFLEAQVDSSVRAGQGRRASAARCANATATAPHTAKDPTVPASRGGSRYRLGTCALASSDVLESVSLRVEYQRAVMRLRSGQARRSSLVAQQPLQPCPTPHLERTTSDLQRQIAAKERQIQSNRQLLSQARGGGGGGGGVGGATLTLTPHRVNTLFEPLSFAGDESASLVRRRSRVMSCVQGGDQSSSGVRSQLQRNCSGSATRHAEQDANVGGGSGVRSLGSQGSGVRSQLQRNCSQGRHSTMMKPQNALPDMSGVRASNDPHSVSSTTPQHSERSNATQHVPQPPATQGAHPSEVRSGDTSNAQHSDVGTARRSSHDRHDTTTTHQAHTQLTRSEDTAQIALRDHKEGSAGGAVPTQRSTHDHSAATTAPTACTTQHPTEHTANTPYSALPSAQQTHHCPPQLPSDSVGSNPAPHTTTTTPTPCIASTSLQSPEMLSAASSDSTHTTTPSIGTPQHETRRLSDGEGVGGKEGEVGGGEAVVEGEVAAGSVQVEGRVAEEEKEEKHAQPSTGSGSAARTAFLLRGQVQMSGGTVQEEEEEDTVLADVLDPKQNCAGSVPIPEVPLKMSGRSDCTATSSPSEDALQNSAGSGPAMQMSLLIKVREAAPKADVVLELSEHLHSSARPEVPSKSGNSMDLSWTVGVDTATASCLSEDALQKSAESGPAVQMAVLVKTPPTPPSAKPAAQPTDHPESPADTAHNIAVKKAEDWLQRSTGSGSSGPGIDMSFLIKASTEPAKAKSPRSPPPLNGTGLERGTAPAVPDDAQDSPCESPLQRKMCAKREANSFRSPMTITPHTHPQKRQKEGKRG